MTRRQANRRRGIVLIIVLWAVAILAVICLALGGTAQYRQTHARRGREAAVERAGLLAAGDRAKRLILDDTPDADTLADAWSGTDAARFTLELNGRSVRLVADEAAARWGLTDEAARLNANTADAETLAALPEMTRAVAEAFVALRDAGAGGADALSAPVPGPTGPLATPDEVLGVLDAAFERSGLGGAPEAPGEMVSDAARAVEPYLTVFTRQRNVTADGAPRVNLNMAGRDELADRLGDVLDDAQLDAIVAWRDAAPFAGIGGLLLRERTVPDGQGGEQIVRVGRAAFTAIADRLTVTDEAILVGRVNVNTAPTAVLAALPALSEANAAALVDARADIETPGNIAWTLSVLDDGTFAGVCERLTTRTAQFRLHARCDTFDRPRGSTHSPAREAVAVIERDAGRVRTVYWSQW
ncbi:MAG: general secretion pathway protein GspK [Phycisphaerae bacterium]|nr:general secretion pathway protein GspK [Phycisphaerae bacterium]